MQQNLFVNIMGNVILSSPTPTSVPTVDLFPTPVSTFDAFPVTTLEIFLPDEVLIYLLSFIDDDKTENAVELLNKQSYGVLHPHRYRSVEIEHAGVKHTVPLYYRELGNKYYIIPPHHNFSKYKCPQRHIHEGNSDVHTDWNAMQVDINTLLVHTGDFRYTKSTGFFNHHGPEYGGKVPLGSAFDCESPNSMTGISKIDLRGTKFAVANKFTVDGCCPNGDSKFSSNKQVVDLRGGGYCGSITCELADSELKASQGGYFLQLKWV